MRFGVLCIDKWAADGGLRDDIRYWRKELDEIDHCRILLETNRFDFEKRRHQKLALKYCFTKCDLIGAIWKEKLNLQAEIREKQIRDLETNRDRLHEECRGRVRSFLGNSIAWLLAVAAILAALAGLALFLARALRFEWPPFGVLAWTLTLPVFGAVLIVVAMLGLARGAMALFRGRWLRGLLYLAPIAASAVLAPYVLVGLLESPEVRADRRPPTRSAVQAPQRCAEWRLQQVRETKQAALPVPHCVTVFYATNREQSAPGGSLPNDFSASEPSSDLAFGAVDIAVPRIGPDRGAGRWNLKNSRSSVMNQLESATDAIPYFRVTTIEPFEGEGALALRTEFVKKLGAAFGVRRDPAAGDSAKRRALLFVHGFNVSFQESVVRAAELAVDLALEFEGSDVDIPTFRFGRPVVFSWPSQAIEVCMDPWNAPCLLRAWPQADAQASDAAGRLSETLDLLINGAEGASADLDELNIVAHSLGNKVLIEAAQLYRESCEERQCRRIPIRIVSAAPAVEDGAYRNGVEGLAALTAGAGDRATNIYASEKDLALWAQKLVGDWPAGLMAPTELRSRAGARAFVVEQEPFATVDVSELSDWLLPLPNLGHGYYEKQNSAVMDMACALSGETTLRALKPKRYRQGSALYWRMDGRKDRDNSQYDPRCVPRLLRDYYLTIDECERETGASCREIPDAAVAAEPTRTPAPDPAAIAVDAQCRDASAQAGITLRVLFDSRASEFPTDAPALCVAAWNARANDAAWIRVVGHADTRQDGPNNCELSKQRAQAVADELVRRDVDRARIVVIWKGESDLAVPTADETEEPLNRRVEITVEQGEKLSDRQREDEIRAAGCPL